MVRANTTLANFRDDANRDFLDHVDPFVFAKAAFLVTNTDVFSTKDLQILAEQFGSTEAEVQKDLVKTGAVMMHQYRFFQAEAAIMLMLAGIPEEPILATLKRLKANVWDDALRHIARGEVPAAFALTSNDESLGFEDWIIAAIVHDRRNNSEGHDSIVEYISGEARFLQKNGRFNAFKHGARAKGASFRLEMQPKDTPGILMIMAAEHAIFWAEWPKLDEYAYTLSAKEFDPKRDQARINFGAQLVRLWKQLRQKDFEVGAYSLFAFDIAHEPVNGYTFTHRYSRTPPP